jgi:hypothetical protein
MIASAAKGFCEAGSGACVDCQKPCSISAVITRLEAISPFVSDAQPGRRPGSEKGLNQYVCLAEGGRATEGAGVKDHLLFTIYAISCLGSPPTS